MEYNFEESAHLLIFRSTLSCTNTRYQSTMARVLKFDGRKVLH